MPLSRKSYPQLSGKVVLLSIKPRFAELILAGTKQVEFRRSWATQDVRFIVLYSSSPVQKIVGVAEVADVLVASPTALWKTCSEKGGGLTREELRTYFSGKSQGVAVLLERVHKFSEPIEPSEIISNFSPPQSFRYLHESEFLKLSQKP